MKKNHGNNPFRPIGLTRKTVLTRPRSGPYVNLGTGEMVEVQGLSKEVEVDADPMPFVKLFADALKILPLLSKPSLTLFCYMAENLKPSKPTVMLRRELAVQHSPSLKGTGWYKAVRQLTQLGVIAEKGMDEYWVNPNVVFNGRRKIS